ncbi:1-acyl-sn-glycerol-3-phosphate acyltransferase [Phenylobacterium sp. LH3H17]|uniref:lysophospholipid acyltransferase family protein n=1 Tax=Phenylobacterium sp. LH3H17 TaxID=2903901 RepID=UPI0020C99F11|nr:lysophospholipid acyltransferase family protein [Phenylobacterium sp. LH3H17]UTP40600.1 1-acyl-sn-glycerol-3-phosphate acyltransferase [Phenylobacterium sp. LH3H17]
MRWLRRLVLVGIARPIARIFTGADIIGRERLPLKGPAILAANHASHVDTILMLTLYPSKALDRVRPAAAADYFLKGGLISWLSNTIIGIVPVHRDKAGTGVDVLAPVREALKAGDIVLIFPEGTRGDGEEMSDLKSGVARLAADVPEAPVYPIWLQGAGRVLPKGEVVPVPMNCTVLVGEPIYWQGDRKAFMEALRVALEDLHAKAPPQRWA